MKKLVIAAAAAVALTFAIPTTADAQQGRPGGFGLGLGWGTHVTGISGKLHTGGTALQGVLGTWGPYFNNRGIGLSADFLVNMPQLHDAGVVQLAWNLGGGGALGIGPSNWYTGRWHRNRFTPRADFVLQVQGTAGFEFIFPEVPLDVVVEWKPAIQLAPTPLFLFPEFGFHVRYYIQ